MLILPTIYRPESVERFIKAYRDTDGTLPVHVVLDQNNVAAYRHIKMPDNFKRVRVPSGMRLGDIFNLIFKKFPNEEFYGMVADDVVPETCRWDLLLREACLPDKISWGWDGIQNDRLPVHPFIGGDLVRKLGWWAPPGIKHWYVDNAWKDIAAGLGVERYMPEIRMKHVHMTNGLAPRDRTYNSQPDPRADEINYNIWRERDYPRIIERLTPRL